MNSIIVNLELIYYNNCYAFFLRPDFYAPVPIFFSFNFQHLEGSGNASCHYFSHLFIIHFYRNECRAVEICLKLVDIKIISIGIYFGQWNFLSDLKTSMSNASTKKKEMIVLRKQKKKLNC